MPHLPLGHAFRGGMPAEARVTWAWLSRAELDLGAPDDDAVDGERTAWLYAAPCRVLGVRASADRAEVHRAYRRVLRLHHPDLNPDDPGALGRFHEVAGTLALVPDGAMTAGHDGVSANE